jgi:hypothetical protein
MAAMTKQLPSHGTKEKSKPAPFTKTVKDAGPTNTYIGVARHRATFTVG